MKFIKKLLLFLLGLLVLGLIVAAFVPKTFTSERQIIINQPRDLVFDYVKNIKNQDHYGVWQLSDPEMKKSYNGTDGTVGFVYSWDSKELGKGSQTITEIERNERIDTKLDFGFGDPAEAYMLTKEAGSGKTMVIWGIQGHSPYPFNIMNLFYDMGKDFDKGLQNLKHVLEARPSGPDGSMAFLNAYFQQTTDSLQKAVGGLSEAQLRFQPSEGQWSVAQCLEHIVASETMLFGMAKDAMEQPAHPEWKAEVKTSDAALIHMMTDRTEKHKAPEALQPSGKYTDAAKALADLATARNAVLTYLQQADLDSLRNHISDYPTGKADGYQNFLFIAAHCARHTQQIREIMANPDFPKQ